MKILWLMLLLCGTSQAATLADLNAVISTLDARVVEDQVQNLAVIDAIQTVLAPPQSLTVGTIGAQRNQTVDLVIHYKASTAAVSALQFDLVLPQGFSANSVVAGIASQAAGKSIQANLVATGYRVIIFGLNTTAIPSGSVAVIRIRANNTVSLGKIPLTLVGVSGSSATGTSVPLTIKAGSVTIR